MYLVLQLNIYTRERLYSYKSVGHRDRGVLISKCIVHSSCFKLFHRSYDLNKMLSNTISLAR